MKIARTIERAIRVTPEEIYAALAAQYDLPTEDVEVAIDWDDSHREELVLRAASTELTDR